MAAVDGLLIDLDGTVWEGDSLVPGAVEAVDDPESDVRGARSAGLTAVQVETGKFDPGGVVDAPGEERPHHRIRSIAGLPELLDGPLA